ncbi:protein FAM114A2 [Clonorchis sinensis]|uniref:Protein FAM114A2 n=1 Tax=Clonorchis sinensis TaxID=79923 RepID=H2KUC4_CLOSI|nr:protein FAM114A2 [Clonorchis sinensis]
MHEPKNPVVNISGRYFITSVCVNAPNQSNVQLTFLFQVKSPSQEIPRNVGGSSSHQKEEKLVKSNSDQSTIDSHAHIGYDLSTAVRDEEDAEVARNSQDSVAEPATHEEPSEMSPPTSQVQDRDDFIQVETEGSAIPVLHDSQWNPDVISFAASNFVRGVGGGLSTLAGVLAHAIQTAVEDEPADVTERRKERQNREEAEREAIAEAWSSVWNSTWGTGGWGEDEDSQLPDPDLPTESKPASATVNDNTASASVSDLAASTHEEPTSFWGWSGVSSFAQQLTTSLQTKSLTLVQEGVNVLEKIGKKTMSVIEENDPGFQYTKKFLRPPGLRDRPNLSQVIREAYERDQSSLSHTDSAARDSPNKSSLSAYLERNRALVHLEALELVSDQAESQLHIRLQQLPEQTHDLTLERIWCTLQLEDAEDNETETYFEDATVLKLLKNTGDSKDLYGCRPEDLSEEHMRVWIVLQQSLSEFKLIYPGERLLRSLTEFWNRIQDTQSEGNAETLFAAAIITLADVTSAYLEYLHKVAECILVRDHEALLDFSWLTSVAAALFRAAFRLQSATSLEYIKLIKTSRKSLTGQATLEFSPPVTSTTQFVANILLECNNAQTYLRNTARLLVPVFQLACLNSSLEVGSN